MSIYKAMVAIGGDLKAIAKGQTNQQQGFKFRGIDDVYNALQPLLVKHGVSCWPSVISLTNESLVIKNKYGEKNAYRAIVHCEYKMVHVDGTSDKIISCGEGMDYGDKSTSKALAIAHKYALLQACCIPTEDLIDPDSESPALMTAKTESFETKQKSTTAKVVPMARATAPSDLLE